ncbi:hypothetical protein ABIE45_004540 [Methylobacterium sp. OAE515]|uniref:hypothetical protein n=1 Tax=Methylobacterium sp. OAE515 TaxID=2817895 RepID=UPI00178A3027
MKFHVEPVSKKTVVPPHPIEGPMPAEGGADWIADQYTLRLILDGVIRRTDEGVAEAAEQDASSRRRASPVPTPPTPAPGKAQEA